ncbi:thermopsin, partial [Acidianus hospitalis]
MRTLKVLLLALLVLPLFSFFTQSLPLHCQIQLPYGHYECAYENVTQGNGIDIIFYASSPITFMIMSPLQFCQFLQGNSSQSIYSITASSLSEFFPLPSGQYYIVFYNNVSDTTVTLNYYVLTRPLPTGIADYGLKVSNGTVSPYIEKIKSVIGAVEINKLLAYNSTPPSGIGQYCASIQLNVVLQVNTISGTRQIWLQNVIQINTYNNSYRFIDNIWNFTSCPSILSNKCVKGNGRVCPPFPLPFANDYYAYCTNYFTLFSPSIEYLIINTSYTSQGPIILFGYMNQSGYPVWYDNVSILIPGTLSASILIDGYNLTGSNHSYDAELILGGGGNGEFTFFNESNVELAMIYQYLNGTLAPPKYLFPFGLDTEESADNLYTIAYKGAYLVSTGYQVINNLNGNISQLRFNVVNYTKVTDQHFPYLFTINISGGVLPYKLNITIFNSTNELSAYTYVLFPALSSYYLPLSQLFPGNYTVKIELTDFNRNSIYYEFPLTINPPLKVRIINVTNFTDISIPFFNFTSILCGGTKPYNVTVMIYNGSGLLSEIHKILNCSSHFTINMKGYTEGIYTIEIKVEDQIGSLNISKYNFTINPDPEVKLIMPNTSIDAGVEFQINANISLGTPPYYVSWYINGSYIGGESTDKLNLTSPGIYNITAVVRDSVGYVITVSKIITIVPPPSLSVNEQTQGNFFQYNTSILLTTTVKGGTDAYYLVYLNGNLIGNYSSTTHMHLNLQNGENNITILAKDLWGESAEETLMVNSGYNYI